MKTRIAFFIAAAVLAVSSLALAQDAENLVVPTFRKVNGNNYGDNVLQFKVADKGVHSISVMAKTYSKDGRVDRQIFELTGKNDRGAFPNTKGQRMWESDKIYASHDIWSKNKGNIDRVEFSYVVRKYTRDGQRAPVESKHNYTFAHGNEIRSGYAKGAIQRAGQNKGRGLDRMDARDVQAAMDRLSKRPPHARYHTLPGAGPDHPLHAERRLVKAINSMAKQANMVHHPMYPYRTPQGKKFGARDSMYNFINKGTKSLTMLDYVHADRDIAGATGHRAQKGANVNVFLNAWKVKNHGGTDNANYLRSLGAKVHLVWQDGSSPIHHKEGVANNKWVRGGSLNPGHWSFTSDETMYVIRSKKLGKQVQGQANRLAHNYAVEGWGGSRKPTKKTSNVQFEVRIPTNINPKDIQGVYFGVGGSPEAKNSWVKLTKATSVKRTRKNKVVYRGSRRLPTGFNHQGKPVIVLKNGQQIWSKTNDTHFTVQRTKAGRQRIRAGFRK